MRLIRLFICSTLILAVAIGGRVAQRAIAAEVKKIDVTQAKPNRPITLRDVLTFRLGYGLIFAPPGQYPIQAAVDEAGFSPGPQLPSVPPEELMKRYGSLPLLHQPGERWLYNSGSDILGVLNTGQEPLRVHLALQRFAARLSVGRTPPHPIALRAVG